MSVSEAKSDKFSGKYKFQIRLFFSVLGLDFPNAPELKHQLLHQSCLVADQLDCC